MEFAQKKDGWCGPAALSYALNTQGVEVPQEQIVKETNTTVRAGVDPKPLEQAARFHGMETHILQGGDPEETLNQLQFYLEDGWTAILDYLAGDDFDDGHYVTLLEILPRGLKVFDPSSGGSIKTLQKENFIRHWKDKTKDGRVFRYYALLLTKK